VFYGGEREREEKVVNSRRREGQVDVEMWRQGE
jgi:hypothetical protein